jgi:fructuronate reductase
MRLSAATLNRLPDTIARPAYDRSSLSTGIVHLGIGAFHRAHQAACTHRLLARDPRWGILGASLLRADTHDSLAPQDWLYTLALRDGNGDQAEVIGTLTGILVAPRDPATLVARMAAPDVRIVTLTVTEKAYRRHAATGALDADDAAIRRDLRALERPETVPGLLLAALRSRRAAGLEPFTILCCDNLPSNGAAVKRILTDFANLAEPGLGRWIEDSVACPACMVDRIVPATTDTDRAAIGSLLGMEDAWPVIAEPFLQWVIEDDFPLGRPEWEAAGAEFVRDVRPYEEMKLRLLNGSHSSIAYLGQLAGWRTVAEAMREPALVRHVQALMQELATTLHMPAGTDIPSYCAALLARFRNPALLHATAQIAMDGSQKLPQLLLQCAEARLAAGQGVHRIALGIAAWMRFCQGHADDGAALPLEDPMADRLRALAQRAGNAPALADALFGVREIFPAGLVQAAPFRSAVVAALETLMARGARETLRIWNHAGNPVNA